MATASSSVFGNPVGNSTATVSDGAGDGDGDMAMGSGDGDGSVFRLPSAAIGCRKLPFGSGHLDLFLIRSCQRVTCRNSLPSIS